MIMISQHDPESTIMTHDVAAVLNLQTIKHKDSGEEVKSVTFINETIM